MMKLIKCDKLAPYMPESLCEIRQIFETDKIMQTFYKIHYSVPPDAVVQSVVMQFEITRDLPPSPAHSFVKIWS